MSRIVPVDFVQISPTRTASVTNPDDSGTRLVTVSGYSYVDSGPQRNTSDVEVLVEVADLSRSGENDIWRALNEHPIRLEPIRQGGALVTWTGQIEPPEWMVGHRWRLTIAEYEYFRIEDGDITRPDEVFEVNGMQSTRKLTFAETVYLD